MCLRHMNAPGRRGRFATNVAKSSDDACAEGALSWHRLLIDLRPTSGECRPKGTMTCKDHRKLQEVASGGLCVFDYFI